MSFVFNYPLSKKRLQRITTNNPAFEQIVIDDTSNSILYFDSASIEQITGSQLDVTCSNAMTASWAQSIDGLNVVGNVDNSLNAVNALNSQSSSYALTSSFALNGGGSGGGLIAGTWDHMIASTWDALKN